MFKNKLALVLGALTVFAAGCASYHAQQLAVISQEWPVESLQNNGVSVVWKTFNKADCETYLGRDVIAEGYVPVQMTIRNESQDSMYLNPSNFSVSVPAASDVAIKMHTSTAGRVIAWGIPGLFFSPLLIPAIYDGIKSSEANKYLDADYQSKSVKEQTIQPYEVFNGVVFVPKNEADKDLSVMLVNMANGEKLVFKKI